MTPVLRWFACALAFVLLLFPQMALPASAETWWTDPIPLPWFEGTDHQMFGSLRPVAAHGAEVRVVWTARFGEDRAIVVMGRSSDGGATFSIQRLSDSSAYLAGQGCVVARPQGGFLFAWSSKRSSANNDTEVYVSTEWPIGQLSPPRLVTILPPSSWLQQLLMASDGVALLVYYSVEPIPPGQDNVTGIRTIASGDGEGAWGNASLITGDPVYGVVFAGAATTGAGFLIAWSRYIPGGTEIFLSRASSRNLTWTHTSLVTTDRISEVSAFALSPNGSAVVTWEERPLARWIVSRAPYDSAENPRNLTLPGSAEYDEEHEPRIAFDASGIMHAVWMHRYQSGLDEVRYAAADKDWDWEPEYTNLERSSDGPFYDLFLATDDLGIPIAGWCRERRLPPGTVPQDIYRVYITRPLPDPPTIDSPSDGQIVDGPFTARGTTGERTFVQVAVAGGRWQNATGSPAWQLDLGTPALPPGTHHLSARACWPGGGFCSISVWIAFSVPPYPFPWATVALAAGLVGCGAFALVIWHRRRKGGRRKGPPKRE